MSLFQIAVVSVTLAVFASSGSARAQTNDANQTLADKIDFSHLDGPYRYKSPTDSIAVVGYVTEDKGADGVVFRDCDGHTNTVKRTDLTHIQRNCLGDPKGPWGVWVRATDDKMVPASGLTEASKVYLGSEMPEIHLKNLPAEFKAQVEAAKPGDWVGLSYPSNGKVTLSIFPKPGTPAKVE